VHGARFDLETGEALDLPATQAIPVYPVRVVGDWIEVCLERSN
jgi:3-phenylpropionate/trans-cinnamate dioxygenase ferredoxin subunit